MTAHAILYDLLGGIALLLFATRMVKTGILRAYEQDLGTFLRRATRRALGGLFAGIAVATAMQSSTAAALLTAAFVERGFVALAPALAVMLGADIGSTIVVQVMAFDLTALVPALMLGGFIAFVNPSRQRLRQLGRIAIGLALMILALRMIVTASAPLRGSETLDILLVAAGNDPVIAVLLAAGLTWLVHSGVATVLLLASLAGTGVLPIEVALVLLVGVNIGAGLIPLGLAAGAPPATARLLYGNLAFRTVGGLGALALLPVVAQLVALLPAAPAHAVAVAHMVLNIGFAVVFLPLVGPVARLLVRLVPDKVVEAGPEAPMHLDPELLDRPRLALGAASREVMRLADLVEAMLRDAILTFEREPKVSIEAVTTRDNAIDRLQEEIKLYLTRLTRQPLSESEAREAFDLIVFTTNLEHIGDIIDKSLMALAAKIHRNGVHFSDDGWREIQALHRQVLDQLRLAVTVFVTRDEGMARELVAAKEALRAVEREAVRSHLGRLAGGSPATVDSSAVHLDVIRDLKRISGHVATVAHPILEQRGLIGASRLVPG